ncbi:MAG: D-alanyl-D-alanine carboxypeptidase family protein [Pelagibacteraceae bacterium]|jgi:D-alanyl-D-alanine carboxypeptidase (penicillin-binding protein 5/6)
MIKIFKYIFILILINFNIASAEPKIAAKTAIVIDFQTDKILYELEPDISIYPASMTKIMTTIIAFDLLKAKKLSLDDKFFISEKAWRMSQAGYSSMFIMINDQISVENLLRGIIVASGNDACVALAEGIAGSEQNFVDMMNLKAQEIGMTNTHFANSSGINDVENYSTVRDIALMSKYLIKNYPDYYHYYAEQEFTWDRTGGDPITQNNRNLLLFRNLGVDGIKTGHLSVEEYSLASSIKKETRRIIAVGSGFKTMASRANQSLRLLNWGLTNSDTFEISKKNNTIFEFKTWLGKEQIVKGYTKEDVYFTVDKKDLRDFHVFLEHNGPIKAPIQKDAEIGNIKIYNNDELLKTVPVYALEKVKKVNFLLSLLTSFNYMIWGDV